MGVKLSDEQVKELDGFFGMGSEESKEPTEDSNEESSEEVGDADEAEESESQQEGDEEEGGDEGEESSEEDDSSKGESDAAKEIAELKAQIAELKGLLTSKGEKKEEEEETQKKESSTESLNLVSEDEFKKILEEGDLETFNSVIAKAVKTGFQMTMGQLPKTVLNLVRQQTEQTQTVNRFWEDNKELRGHETYVKFLATELAKNNPEWDNTTLLKKVAEKAYKDLRIKKGQKEEAKSTEVKKPKGQPKPVGKSGSSGGDKSSKKSGDPFKEKQRAEIDALFDYS